MQIWTKNDKNEKLYWWWFFLKSESSSDSSDETESDIDNDESDKEFVKSILIIKKPTYFRKS